VSMNFINDSLTNAVWSTYPVDGREETHTGRTYPEDGGGGYQSPHAPRGSKTGGFV
jgi:hypothetical protein